MSFEFVETVTLQLPNLGEQITPFTESHQEDKKLIIEVAAIHAGLTSNYNMYSAQALAESISSWVQPYPKPIILNHDPLSESIGRVMAASMDKEDDGTEYVRLQVGITSPEAISKVMDERYLTGSVGGKCKEARCSICGVDWAGPSEGYSMPCKHKRGKVYNGKLAYFELTGLSFKEYSFVNMPADERSGLRSVGAKTASGDESGDEKNDWVKAVKFYSLNMNKESIIELNESGEGLDVLSQFKRKKDARFTYQNLKGTFLTMNAYDDLHKEDITDSDEKLTNMQSYTTIDKELEHKDVSEDLEAETAEENNMSDKNATEVVEEQEEDILAVAEQLSADLAQASAEESAENSDAEEAEVEESSENSDNEETDSTDAAEESDEEEPVQEEETASEDEPLTETIIDSEEQATEDEVVEEASDATDTAELESLRTQVEKLTNENAKLKGTLHKMLAERVVDAKIACGLVDAANRSEALAEHATRTASSLADSVRDVEKLMREADTFVASKDSVDIAGLPKVDQTSNATDTSEGNTVTVNADGKEVTINEFSPEDLLFNLFMGRK
jgi:hypothetical protein